MYNEYFGLTDPPFSIAPNPQFLYMSERHREALAHLLYGIGGEGGFIVLTGEVGTGKTTVCRCVLAQMPDDVDTAYVLNPKQTAQEMLATVCDEFGIPYPARATVKVLVDRLNEFLLASHRIGRRSVLIIDEAQNLSIDVLEQLRLLTNLETNERKLLQIILLGQPELLDMLERNDLRQLAQRITARFHLGALAQSEVGSYIRHRLEVAGCKNDLFLPDSVSRIWTLTGGVPRLINLICDRSLLGAYAKGQRQIDPNIVDQAAIEIFGRRTKRSSNRRRQTVVAAAAIIALVVAGFLVTLGMMRSDAPTIVANASVGTPANGATANLTATKTRSAAVDPAGAVADPPPDKPSNPPQQAEDSATAIHTTHPQSGNAETTNSQTAGPPATDSLIRVVGDGSAGAAMSQLFALWGMPFHASEISPCQQAQQFGLSCKISMGSLADLNHLDRPAVIDLSIAGINNFLAVTHIDGDIVDVESSRGKFRLKKSDVVRNWDGNFAILWKPPPDYRIVKPGDKGPMVDRLIRQLAEINKEKATPVVGATFDAKLESRLKQFQVSEGLKPDGIAGANTWIHINSLVDKNVPRLSSAGGS